MGEIDCLIVGAGAAGLACARLLHGHLNFVVLDARARTGGRVHTLKLPDLKVPIELGAEFIHGTPSSILSALERTGQSFYDVLDRHEFLKNGKLQETDDFWEQMQSLTKKLDGDRADDRTVREFLEAHSSNKETKALFKAYVEGFHAADLNLISERGLASAEQTDENDLNGASLFRPTGGYRDFLSGFAHELPKTAIRLNTVVRRIEWKKGLAVVHSVNQLGEANEPIRSKRIVVTLPNGVLKHGSVEIDPLPIEVREALESIYMGHVVRISFVFRSRFWERIVKDPIGFLHAGPEFEFPTWWTSMPIRSPVLVAWQGGPKAEELTNLSSRERAAHALNTLSKLTGISRARIGGELVGFYTHNWSKDPFSLGAYSYLGIDGDRKVRALAKSYDDTLYFAGEATNEGDSRGTVDGAIDTGERSARQILDTI